MRRGPKPAKSKEAKPPVARKSLKDDGARVHDLKKRLAEALRGKAEALKLHSDSQEQLQTRDRELVDAQEQQTATSGILRVISSSPTDVQPVLEAIADSAMRLFRAWAAAVFRYEGQLISMAAARGGLPGSAEAVMAHLQAPHAPTEERPEGRAALTRTIQHVIDVEGTAALALMSRSA